MRSQEIFETESETIFCCISSIDRNDYTDKGDAHTKGQGQRSEVKVKKVTEMLTLTCDLWS